MAEYKAKLLKGLFTQAKNVVFTNGAKVENLNTPSVLQKAGTTLTITGFGNMTFYNAVTNCIIQLPFVPRSQCSYSINISIHGENEYTRTGTLAANATGLRITDIGVGRSGTFSYSMTITF